MLVKIEINEGLRKFVTTSRLKGIKKGVSQGVQAAAKKARDKHLKPTKAGG